MSHFCSLVGSFVSLASSGSAGSTEMFREASLHGLGTTRRGKL